MFKNKLVCSHFEQWWFNEQVHKGCSNETYLYDTCNVIAVEYACNDVTDNTR